jgi:hypothetical protein
MESPCEGIPSVNQQMVFERDYRSTVGPTGELSFDGEAAVYRRTSWGLEVTTYAPFPGMLEGIR